MPCPTTGVGIDFVIAPATAPQLTTGVRIVCVHTTLTVDDDFIMVLHANGNRRTPTDVGFAVGPPHHSPGPRFECGDERACELILVEDDAIPVHERRARGPVVHVHRAQIPLPDDGPIQVDGQQSPAAKRHIHAFPVGDWRGRRVTILGMRGSVAPFRSQRFPKTHSIGTAERENRQPPAVECRREDHSITPDDR